MSLHSIYPVLPQRFPFLAPLMSFIYAQRTATLHSKLIQSCKYFFVKDPIMVINCVIFQAKKVGLDEVECNRPKKSINLAPNKLPCKLWVCKKLYMVDSKSFLYLDLLYRLENVELRLYPYHYCHKFSNLIELARKGNCKKLNISGYNVIDSDDLQVPIEYIFELFPGAESYEM